MSIKTTGTALKWFALLVSLALLAANVARILTIPATKDEVIMYPYLHHTYGELVRLDVLVTANFHLLNLVITKFCITHFADNLFFLRLGSLMGLVIFLCYSWRISTYCFRTPPLAAAAFLLLNANPFLLEFWTLSRGYGLAIAFMLGSIYHAARFLRGDGLRHIVVVFVFALLSVYSNFSLLYFYLGLLGALALNLALFSERSQFMKRAVATLIAATGTSAVMYLLIAGPIQKLVEAKELYHGGKTGIYTDTLRTLVKESLFLNDVNAPVITVIAWLAIGITVMAAAFIVHSLARRDRSPGTQSLIFFFVLVVVPLAANAVQHHRDGTLYLIDRAALFLYIPFILLLVSSIQVLLRNPRYASATVFIFTGLAMFNFARTFSLYTSWERAFDSANTALLDRMSAKGPNDRKVRFRSFWLFGESMEYHVATTHKGRFDISRSDMHLHEPTDTTQDYYYVPVEFQHKFAQHFTADTFVTVKNTDSYGGKYVLMRKNSQ